MLRFLPSSSLPSRCSCMPEIHEQCFMPDSRRQVRAQKAGCLPSERAACTHSWNASTAAQKVAGVRSFGCHHSAWNICSCTSVIGISSERRIITAVRKWCPVPSAPATKIRFVGATPGALPPPPSADARAYGRQKVSSIGVSILSRRLTLRRNSTCDCCPKPSLGGGLGAEASLSEASEGSGDDAEPSAGADLSGPGSARRAAPSSGSSL
mmetsp:Transcript_12021/g.35557  ORF Transcript_12021/g.35557 Transcript_12021/m.35557 type:complete len:210 (-) Transcript_12021:289-918(-)